MMIRNLFDLMLLVMIWCGFSNDFTLPTILLGSIISWLIILIVNRHSTMNFGVNPLYILNLLGLVFVELIKSSIIIAIEVLGLTKNRQPKIIMMPLSCENDVQKTILTILISLTPGTLSIDMKDNKQILSIHVMFSSKAESTISFIKNRLEKNVRRAFYVK